MRAGATGAGALWSRSITDFATSAAERIGFDAALGSFGAAGNFRTALLFLATAALAAGARGCGALAGEPARFFAAAFLGAAFFGAAFFGAAFFGAAFFAGAAARAGLAGGVPRAASSFFLASFAAFFSALNFLRAFLRWAFNDLTDSLAEAARPAALPAAVRSRRSVAVIFERSGDVGAGLSIVAAGASG